MEKQSENIPILPTPEELEWKLISSLMINLKEKVEMPYSLLQFEGIGMFFFGGLGAISGHSGHGKTQLVTMIAAASLGSGTKRVTEYLPGLTVPTRTLEHKDHQLSVLIVDTEQEKPFAHIVKKRIHWLNGWPLDEDNERLHTLWLNEVDGDNNEKAFEKRYKYVKIAIKHLKPDVVIIDGIADLLGNFNSLEESFELLNDLKVLASKNDICIICILHYNPSPGDAEVGKMRGHLGTCLTFKASFGVSSRKDNKKTNPEEFEVAQFKGRGKRMEQWLFNVVDDDSDLGIPKIIGKKNIPQSTGHNSKGKRDMPQSTGHDSREDIIKWLSSSCDIGGCKWPLSKNDIKKQVFHDIGGVTNGNRLQADIKFAVDEGILVETPLKKGGYPMYAISDDLPL